MFTSNLHTEWSSSPVRGRGSDNGNNVRNFNSINMYHPGKVPANNKIDDFTGWGEIIDYESDAGEVTLINTKGKKVATFNYIMFTRADFDRFKNVIQKV